VAPVKKVPAWDAFLHGNTYGQIAQTFLSLNGSPFCPLGAVFSPSPHGLHFQAAKLADFFHYICDTSKDTLKALLRRNPSGLHERHQGYPRARSSREEFGCEGSCGRVNNLSTVYGFLRINGLLPDKSSGAVV